MNVMFFKKTYFPMPDENRMADVGNVAKAREAFLKHRPSNLEFLLKKRYIWMNEFIGKGECGIEIGCGTGLSKQYIKAPNFFLTDYADHSWIDKKVDALDMPFDDNSLDFIISSNMIHHVATPIQFFRECSRVLKPNGKIIIQELNGSLIMRLLLTIMKHEGYSYEVDVFSRDAICNDPNDLWSANCVIPNLLFDDIEAFEKNIPFKIIHQKHTEFLIFPLSGGVIAKKKTISLPVVMLKMIDMLDNFLIALSKSVFPLQRQIVLCNSK